MIISSKEALLITANDHKEFFMFDPKTTAVLHKYRTQEMLTHIAYHQHSQQILAQQLDKTFISLWNWDSQEVEIKMSLSETMSTLKMSGDSHYLLGGSSTGSNYLRQEIYIFGNYQEDSSSRRKPCMLQLSATFIPTKTITS